MCLIADHISQTNSHPAKKHPPGKPDGTMFPFGEVTKPQDLNRFPNHHRADPAQCGNYIHCPRHRAVPLPSLFTRWRRCRPFPCSAGSCPAADKKNDHPIGYCPTDASAAHGWLLASPLALVVSANARPHSGHGHWDTSLKAACCFRHWRRCAAFPGSLSLTFVSSLNCH